MHPYVWETHATIRPTVSPSQDPPNEIHIRWSTNVCGRYNSPVCSVGTPKDAIRCCCFPRNMFANTTRHHNWQGKQWSTLGLKRLALDFDQSTAVRFWRSPPQCNGRRVVLNHPVVRCRSRSTNGRSCCLDSCWRRWEVQQWWCHRWICLRWQMWRVLCWEVIEWWTFGWMHWLVSIDFGTSRKWGVQLLWSMTCSTMEHGWCGGSSSDVVILQPG